MNSEELLVDGETGGRKTASGKQDRAGSQIIGCRQTMEWRVPGQLKWKGGGDCVDPFFVVWYGLVV